jgi:acyl-CoA thioesterase I
LNKYHSAYGALLLIFQVLTGCGPAATQKADTVKAEAAPETGKSSPETGTGPLVIAFGDSLYAGYQLGPKDGFAPQLQAALRANGAAVSVLNAGVSGDTTSAGKARLTFVLDNAPRAPSLVILGLGGNDMLRGTKPSETRANLTAMMDELKRRKISVILTGMFASPNMGPDYAAAFNPIFPDLAKQYEAPLYPFFLGGVVTDGALMLPDGIHPNKDGVARVVDGIKPLVEIALQTKE